MSKIIELIQALPNLLPLQGATEIAISDAELQLKVIFSDEYKEYLSVYGAIIADGLEFTGIAKSKSRNVISLTQREWNENLNVPHSMYVIEEPDDEGTVIWQDKTGTIYQTSPNSQPRKISKSLAEYLSGFKK